MQAFIISILLFAFSVGYGQSVDKAKSDLEKINNVEQANNYFKKNSDYKCGIKSFNSLADTSNFHKSLINRGQGEIFEQSGSSLQKVFLYKILEKEEGWFYRVQYIFLDRTKLTKRQIDDLRDLILSKLDAGESFESLAKQYSMDQNAARGGDLGWFYEGVTVKDFEEKVKAKRKGDIFKLDIPDQRWYYIVKKTHDDQRGIKVQVLYLQCEK